MQAWESFLKTLQEHFGDETFSKWLRPLKLVHFDAANLYLEAQNSFQIEWFEEHVRPKAKEKLVGSSFRPIKIHITCGEVEPREKPTKKQAEYPKPTPFVFIKDTLLDEMVEENFIFSPANQILFLLLNIFKQQEKPSLDFNPLFLHGPSCCGKTHLFQAFTAVLLKKNVRALYVKAETFTENVVGAIRSGNMHDFRKEHRHVDVLIFDNVQYLAKKAATQEEFFHTFNALHSQGKQILLSADVPPTLLGDIEPRLISRFEWGLVLPIHKLEKEHLLLMLKMRSKHLNFPISESVLKFLIDTFPSHIKSLQKSLDALVLRTSKIKTESITTARAKEILFDLIALEKKQVLSPERIVTCVAHFFSLSKEEILGRSQTQECVLPRQIAMFLCRHELKMPFTKIGDHFKRDHSTVMTSVRSIEEKIEEQDPEASSALVSIKHHLSKAVV
jgi:chromosomal replication initiator protein